MGACRKNLTDVENLAELTADHLDNRDAVLNLSGIVADGTTCPGLPEAPKKDRCRRKLPPFVAKVEEASRHAQKLVRLQQGLVAVINRLSLGVCILDRSFKVIDKNPEFERQLRAYDTFRICPDGKLDMKVGHERAGSAAMTSDALNGRPDLKKQIVPVADAGRARALCIDIDIIQTDGLDGAKSIEGVIIYSMDTNLMSKIDVEPIAKTYELTPTEAELSELICDGLTNAQIAELRGRAVDTINAQVKSVLAKTRCTNRTQLVRLMTSFGTDFLVR
ncbi:MAG: helix-turn-helix transcriptional regulator [Pseudomonadota bacterium]